MEMKLILEIAEDKKLELSEKEAKDLFVKLQEMFGVSVNTWVYPYVRYASPSPTTSWINCNALIDSINTYKVRMY